MEDRIVKFNSRESNVLALHAIPGHFATSNSHINFYIDVTGMKARVSEAEEAAKILSHRFSNLSYADTIVCMDDMDVIGAFLAKELMAMNVASTNQHNAMYIISPEQSHGQMIFRDNVRKMVAGKHAIVLFATATTGKTIQKSIEGIQYYGGVIEGIGAVFSTVDVVNGITVHSLFDANDVTSYQAFPKADCPFCRRGVRIEAVVNGFGYSKV